MAVTNDHLWRHFTRAAARLFVAQQSLSRQIRDLEEEVGAPLVERDRHCLPGHARRRLQDRTLATPLIDDGQHAKGPAIGQRIVHEVHAPPLRRPRRDWASALRRGR